MKKTILISSILLITSSVFSQNVNSNSDAFSLEFVNGISMPNGGFEDFAKNGFNTELSLTKSFCDKLSLGFGAKHSSFNVRQDFGPVQGSRNQFTSTTFDMGPQLSLGSKKFALEFYGRTGLSISSTPEIRMMQTNTDIITGKLDQQSMKALSARVGAKIKTELCTGLQLFVSSEYITTLNSNMNFYSKDLSKAIDAEGRIDPDLAGEIPFTSKSLNFSSLNVNFGVSISLGTCCNGKSSQKSSNPLYHDSRNKGNNPLYKQNSRAVNPMYQQNDKKGENPMYQQRGSNNNPLYKKNEKENENPLYEGVNGGGNTGESSGTKATDYNSSRSNKSEKSGINSNNGNNDDDSSGTKATDYNSSRSNKNSNHSAFTEDDNNNEGGTKATDYNSSRSNKSEKSGINSNNGNNDDDSSGTKATDYNSSRSNKNSNHSAFNEDNNEGGTKAQDYNSSRSNRGIIADPNDDIRVSMTQAEKRKMIKKLKREERARVKKETQQLKEEQKRRKMQANSIY